MSTQVIGAQRRSRMIAALVAIVFTLAVVVVATQAGSIWSSRTGTDVRPAVQVVPTGVLNVSAGHIKPGCRPKWGCDGGAGASAAQS